MTIEDVRYYIFSDVRVIQHNGDVNIVLFEGDLSTPDLDPEVASKNIITMHATALGKIVILVKKEEQDNV